MSNWKLIKILLALEEAGLPEPSEVNGNGDYFIYCFDYYLGSGKLSPTLTYYGEDDLLPWEERGFGCSYFQNGKNIETLFQYLPEAIEKLKSLIEGSDEKIKDFDFKKQAKMTRMALESAKKDAEKRCLSEWVLKLDKQLAKIKELDDK